MRPVHHCLMLLLTFAYLAACPAMAQDQEGTAVLPDETVPVMDTPVLPEAEIDAPEEVGVSPPLQSEGGGDDVVADPVVQGAETDDGVMEPGAEVPQEATDPEMEALIAAELESFRVPLDVDLMPSLFFTKWEHDLLIDARSGANVRPVVPGDVGSELLLAPDSSTVTEAPSEISLGGIAYIKPGSWTIWLNNIRVTPTALLPEIMDLQVYKDRIELDWLDRRTNQIYPIRLRPHEKFNLDTRMFLTADGE